MCWDPVCRLQRCDRRCDRCSQMSVLPAKNISRTRNTAALSRRTGLWRVSCPAALDDPGVVWRSFVAGLAPGQAAQAVPRRACVQRAFPGAERSAAKRIVPGAAERGRRQSSAAAMCDWAARCGRPGTRSVRRDASAAPGAPRDDAAVGAPERVTYRVLGGVGHTSHDSGATGLLTAPHGGHRSAAKLPRRFLAVRRHLAPRKQLFDAESNSTRTPQRHRTQS